MSGNRPVVASGGGFGTFTAYAARRQALPQNNQVVFAKTADRLPPKAPKRSTVPVLKSAVRDKMRPNDLHVHFDLQPESIASPPKSGSARLYTVAEQQERWSDAERADAWTSAADEESAAKKTPKDYEADEVDEEHNSADLDELTIDVDGRLADAALNKNANYVKAQSIYNTETPGEKPGEKLGEKSFDAPDETFVPLQRVSAASVSFTSVKGKRPSDPDPGIVSFLNQLKNAPPLSGKKSLKRFFKAAV